MTEHRVTFVFPDGERTIRAGQDETVLAAAHRQGLKVIAECELGLCGTCKALKEAGEVAVEQEDPEGLTLMDIRNGAILCCQSHARSDLRLRVAYKLAAITKTTHFDFEAPIVDLAWVAGSVVRVRVDVSTKSGIDFLAGQYANITIPGATEHRSYSFSSSPRQTGTLEFLIRVLPQGLMSDYLRGVARVGDRLRISGPFGSFFLRDGDAPLLFIAGGTGLGPFLSMLEVIAAAGQVDRDIRLLYGVNSNEQDLSSLDRLEQLQTRLPRFSYEVAVAAPDAAWTGRRGFVTALLEDAHLAGGQVEAYLCGPPPMVEAGSAWLEAHGQPADRIYFERFVAS